ncbi:cyanophycin synthetase family protein [Limnobacter sp.]|uniref:cyanophycin synthetase family protein n=1 Tax=Limnobacter sp. TaxID=2003368 RepID=UPI002FE317F6
MTQKRLTVLRTMWLDGPNIWTYRSCIEALVDIQELEQFPSNLLPGFYERLTALLPGLVDHRCGIGEPGGFLLRVREGTYAAHMLEHIVIELHTQAGLDVGFGKARMTSKDGVYKMVFRTPDPVVGLACLEAGVRLLHAAIEGTEYDLQAELKVIKRHCDMHGLGPSTQHILDAAYERRIPIVRLNDGNLVQLGHGNQQQRIWTAETSKTSAIAEGIAADKDLCKELLAQCGVPVPEGEFAKDADRAWEIAQDIGLPVVVKPVDGNQGRGVSLELDKKEDIQKAWALAYEESYSGVIVEKFIRGVEHRVLVVNYQIAAVSRGDLVFVEGDGQSSLQTLVDLQINTDPRRGDTEITPLKTIRIESNPVVSLEVQRQGYKGDSIIPAGTQVIIERNSNASEDVTALIHPEIARLCCMAARVVGLDVAGVDLVCEHIDQPPKSQSLAVVEVNAGPGLLMHIKPAKGQPRNVGKPIIESLFPGEANGRIPTISYSGGTEIDGFGPELTEILEDQGHRVGLACDQGLFMNGRTISKTLSANWQAGRNCLINKNLDTLVMQVKPNTILSEGLPFDRSSLAVITSLGSMEGLDEWDILTKEQHFNVVRTVIDLVLGSGHAVINADEVSLLPLRELCDGKVIWISSTASNPVVDEHVKNGGMAVVYEGENIRFLGNRAEAETRSPIALKQPPANLVKTLALAASGWAMDVPHNLLRADIRQRY